MLIPAAEFSREITELERRISVRPDLWPAVNGRVLEVDWEGMEAFASVQKDTNKFLGVMAFGWDSTRTCITHALMLADAPKLMYSGFREFGDDVFRALDLMLTRRGARYVSWECNEDNAMAFPIYEKLVFRGVAGKWGIFPGKHFGMDGNSDTVHHYVILRPRWLEERVKYVRN